MPDMNRMSAAVYGYLALPLGFPLPVASAAIGAAGITIGEGDGCGWIGAVLLRPAQPAAPIKIEMDMATNDTSDVGNQAPIFRRLPVPRVGSRNGEPVFAA